MSGIYIYVSLTHAFHFIATSTLVTVNLNKPPDQM